MARLNEKTIAGLSGPPRGAGAVEHSDDEVRGLRLVVSASGRKSWHLKYRLRRRKRTICLGPWPELSAKDAREMALAYRTKALKGEDPADQRRGMAKDVTFGTHADQYLEHATARGKRSVKDDETRLRLWILPLLSRLPLASVTRRDCERVQAHVRAKRSEASANRVVALLSAVLTAAAQWGRVEKNVCLGIKKYHEVGKETFLTPAELSKLLGSLDEDANRQEADAIRLLAATGCRRTEVFALTWPQVDEAAGALRLERTKNGRGRLVLLNDIAKETLTRAEGYRRPGNDYVFPADNLKGRVVEAKRTWKRAKRRAGIDPKVRLHDLRHSVGSLLGHIYPNAVVAKMLGHLDQRTTARYVHFNDGQLRDAADAVSRRIGEAAGEAARPAE